jgi:hypothetical protein
MLSLRDGRDFASARDHTPPRHEDGLPLPLVGGCPPRLLLFLHLPLDLRRKVRETA